jgi:hypothetical protein
MLLSLHAIVNGASASSIAIIIVINVDCYVMHLWFPFHLVNVFQLLDRMTTSEHIEMAQAQASMACIFTTHRDAATTSVLDAHMVEATTVFMQSPV